MKKIYLNIILLTILPLIVVGQGGDLNLRTKVMFVGINLSPAISNTNFEGEGLSSSGKFGMQFNADFGFYFTKSIGFSFGLGLSSYKSTIDPGSANYSAMGLTDDEGDVYNLHTSVTGYSEEFVAKSFDIPIKLLMRFGNKNGFYLNPGIKFALSRNGEYSGSGNFTISGEYENLGITFSDLPEYGFPTNEKLGPATTEIETSTSMNLIVSTGLFFSIGEKFEIALGAYYEQGLGSIIENKSNFLLTENVGLQPKKFNSLSESCDGVNLGAIGGQISFKFYIR